jgi:hypothetical protein
MGSIIATLLFGCACGGSPAADTNDSVPPFVGNANGAPATMLQPNTAAPSGMMQPPGGGAPPNGEMPAGSDTPVVPAMTDGTPDQNQNPPDEPAPDEPPPDQNQNPPDEPAPDEPPPDQPPPDPPAPRTRVFLLFGQSNMWGVPNPQQQDLATNPRVEVLTVTQCERHGINQWVPAQPPLHGCVGQPGNGTQGPGVGPGDYFAKTLADAFPEDTILLVPNAVPGVSIDTFQPGQPNYNSLVSRARMAQQRGDIAGMIFHQGETDTNQMTWPARVKTVVDRLRSDLGTGEVPFIAGELLIGGCCQVHNNLVNQLPTLITSTSVARANGFAAVTNDGFGNLHFDLPSQREFGRRYGQLMIDALSD